MKLNREYYTLKTIGLKAEEVNIGETFIIEKIEERTFEDERAESGYKTILVALTHLGEEERAININKTTGKMLVDNLGDETDNWIKKQLFVSSIKPTKLGKSIVWAITPE